MPMLIRVFPWLTLVDGREVQCIECIGNPSAGAVGSCKVLQTQTPAAPAEPFMEGFISRKALRIRFLEKATQGHETLPNMAPNSQ